MVRLSLVAFLSLFWVASLEADYFVVKVDVSQFKYSSLVGKGFGPEFVTGDEAGPPRWVIGAYEYSFAKVPIAPAKAAPQVLPDPQKAQVISFHHRWGNNTYLLARTVDNKVVPAFPNVVFDQLTKQISLADEFKKGRGKELLGAKSPDGFIRLAAWALHRGLIKDFHAAMGDLKKFAPGHPNSKIYERLVEALKKPAGTDDPLQAPLLAELRGSGYQPFLSPEGHFVLYHKGLEEASLKRRSSRFEEAFNNFFFWFALQEKMTLPSLPPHRLAVIVDAPGDFLKRRRESSSQQLQGDAFTMRRENVVVLSAKCTADDFVFLENNLQPARTSHGIFTQSLLSGDIWKNVDAQKNMPIIATIQFLTVLQKGIEDESELAAISRETTRQLLGATGMLANNVTAPEWFLTGLTSFFEVPPGSLHPNFGLPSTSNLVAFKQLRKAGKLGKASDALLNLATDGYFRQARADQLRLREAERREAPKKERDRLQANAKESQDMAQSTCWALVYFLSLRKDVPYLRRYALELNELPRHLELSPQTLQTCFGRAFNLQDPLNPQKLDAAKLQALAEAWFQELDNISLESSQFEEFISKAMPGDKK